MKSNLEHKITSAFEQFELPYNEKAWESLNQKLNQAQPLTPKSNPFKWGWIVGSASVITFIAVAIIYTQLNQPVATKTASQQVITKENNSIDKNNTSLQSKNNSSVQTNEATKLSNEKTPNKSITIKDTENSTSSKEHNSNTSVNSTNSNQPLIKEQTNQPVSPNNKSNPKIVETVSVLPDFESSYCLNNTINIENKNDSDLTIVSPSGKEVKLAANKYSSFKLSEEGNYIVYSKNNNKTFKVTKAKSIDFEINDEEKFENGIPAIHMETSSDLNQLEWTIEGSKTKQFGDQAVAHFYKKGNYSITLKGKDENGCVASTSKNITIEEDYNLLAPSAFIPQSDDSRKNHFIPVALLHRNTGFKLFIIEPKSGFVIYETNSTEGWNGQDMNTNNMAEYNNIYIWKVVLSNPEPEEKSEYKGIVTLLKQ